MADFARSESPAVQEQLDRLSTLSPVGDQLGLERITRLLDRLGNPQRKLPPVIHVAGTNGKGSTCALLRSILEASGLKIHVFTSPHLVRFNERIRIAGTLITDQALAALLKEVIDAGDDIQPSFFEVTTAAAFLAFSRIPADACILEVGLGGRLDATNVVERPLSTAIAGLGLDHGQWLGHTLAEIAGEKAAIAKRGVPLVTQRYSLQAAQVVQQVGEKAGAQWITRGALWDARVMRGGLHYRDRHGGLTLPLPELPGRHQADNAALAVAILRHQDELAISERALADGIRSARWPARLQRLSEGPLVDLLAPGSELWIDGGHNAHAARSVADFMRTTPSELPLVILFGCLTSKQPRSMLRSFRGMTAQLLTLPIPDHDSRAPEQLAKVAQERGFHAAAMPTLGDALKAVRSPARVLVFGSLYLAGDALKANGFIPD
jgi:dihydrofolate synthase/folylpolyglutamate synthase